MGSGWPASSQRRFVNVFHKEQEELVRTRASIVEARVLTNSQKGLQIT